MHIVFVSHFVLFQRCTYFSSFITSSMVVVCYYQTMIYAGQLVQLVKRSNGVSLCIYLFFKSTSFLFSSGDCKDSCTFGQWFFFFQFIFERFMYFSLLAVSSMVCHCNDI